MAKAKKDEIINDEAAELVAEDAAEKANQEALTTAEEVAVVEEQETTAKAGKRSAKARKEAEAKQAKEERKAHTAETESEAKPKQTSKPARTHLERQGKKFREAAAKIEKGKAYAPDTALELATQTNPAKFDATVEVHINLNVDPKAADQNVRDSLVLPAGTGKKVRVAVFTDEKVDGADVSGVNAITATLEKGTINFDVLISTPANMPKLGKYARMLGPRGLMPNPKSGTVTNDLAKATAEAKAGRVEYRVDSTGIVHLGIGKVSFGREKLQQNFQAVMASIKNNKPASVKSGYIKAVHISTSMGPSITIAVNEL